jgi:hypothetical protein
MIDSRFSAWLNLLPIADFHVESSLDWLNDALIGSADSNSEFKVLVTSGSFSSMGLDVDRYSALVVVNPEGIKKRDLVSSGFSHIHSFAAVPNFEDARWFVPLGNPRVASASFDLYSPLSTLAKLKKKGVQVASRLGNTGWYRDSVLLALRSESKLHAVLHGAGLGNSVDLALSTGTPGPTRKLSIGVFDRAGTMRAVMKLADSDLPRALLQREASMLRNLATLLPDLPVPRLLADCDVDGRFVTVQTVLRGRQTSPSMDGAHKKFLSDLAGSARRRTVGTSIIGGFPKRLADTQDQPVDLPAATRIAQQLLTGLKLPATITHGDFAPWNLRRFEGWIGAFDWEYGNLDGLPLLDEIHHQLQVGLLFDGWSTERALEFFDRQTSEASPPLTPSHVRGIQLVYLLDVLLRRLEERHGVNETLTRHYIELIPPLLALAEKRA